MYRERESHMSSSVTHYRRYKTFTCTHMNTHTHTHTQSRMSSRVTRHITRKSVEKRIMLPLYVIDYTTYNATDYPSQTTHAHMYTPPRNLLTVSYCILQSETFVKCWSNRISGPRCVENSVS